jgi:hypothetical protein
MSVRISCYRACAPSPPALSALTAGRVKLYGSCLAGIINQLAIGLRDAAAARTVRQLYYLETM